jgi:hypothetical protein
MTMEFITYEDDNDGSMTIIKDDWVTRDPDLHTYRIALTGKELDSIILKAIEAKPDRCGGRFLQKPDEITVAVIQDLVRKVAALEKDSHPPIAQTDIFTRLEELEAQTTVTVEQLGGE